MGGGKGGGFCCKTPLRGVRGAREFFRGIRRWEVRAFVLGNRCSRNLRRSHRRGR